MASTIFPQTISPIKSIQRGSAASAGNITISSVDTNKSFVRSFSTGSAGTSSPVVGSIMTSGSSIYIYL